MNHEEISELRRTIRLGKQVVWHPNGGKQGVLVSFIPDEAAPKNLRDAMRIATGEWFPLTNLDMAHFRVPEFEFVRVPNPRHTPEITAEFDRIEAERTARQDELPKIRGKGEKALYRLLPIAQGHSGQCRHVAAFLLGIYNGQRFRFDLTDLRCLDYEIFDDCMAVLRMDAQPMQEVHQFFEDGNALFEGLAERWGIKDYSNI